MDHNGLFEIWRTLHRSPFAFPMDADIWHESMFEDVDSEGRKLFQELYSEGSPDGLIQYGLTAFGFNESGEISDAVHYPVIRDLCFRSEDDGQKLLDSAMSPFPSGERVYAFFHYFGMSACARHGKLHESEPQVQALLLRNGFTVEHENVYYSKVLADTSEPTGIELRWSKLSAGSCREFAAMTNGQEVCWGQVHFLPQGNIAYLRWIFTDGARQHQGIGSRTMKQLFSELYGMGIRRFDTDTALSNTIAQRYYEKTGFTNEGITRSFYTK